MSELISDEALLNQKFVDVKNYLVENGTSLSLLVILLLKPKTKI